MRLFEFNLYEYDVSKTISTYGDKLISHYSKDHDAQFEKTDADLANKIVSYLESVDPTKKKAFTLPLVRWYAEGSMRHLEDATKAIEPIQLYTKFKNRLSGVNLGTISFSDFLDIGDSLKDQKSGKEQSQSEAQEFFNSGQAQIYADDSKVKIIIPKTKEASIYFGRGTRWCTAGSNYNMFDSYNSKGPLYIIMFKGQNKKWQFHFDDEGMTLMDERDDPIPYEDSDLFDVLIKYFPHQIEKYNITDRFSFMVYQIDNIQSDKEWNSISNEVKSRVKSTKDLVKLVSKYPKTITMLWDSQYATLDTIKTIITAHGSSKILDDLAEELGYGQTIKFSMSVNDIKDLIIWAINKFGEIGAELLYIDNVGSLFTDAEVNSLNKKFPKFKADIDRYKEVNNFRKNK